jgi:O-antigen/teichoic acid export membrane protein
MSNRKLFTRGIVFGYGAITAQILYSFASIPLALGFLSKAEFGMWGLITTIVGYFMLAEMGISNSVMRHLMECKEGKDALKYGRIFTGSALIMGLIALIIAIFGIVASLFVASLFPLPPELLTSFRTVMIAQSLLMGINMGTQMLGIPLYVHHRQDISQVSQIVLFIIYYVVLHLAFKAGWGIYSMLANQAAGILWGVGFNFMSCSRLHFYPKRGTWHLPFREEWASIWRYSRDVFAVQIGGMILSSLPQLMIARLLGLEASATWSVATRPFAILRQIVGRPFDVALPMIYDSYIHGNMKTVTTRWQEVTQVVLAISGATYAVAAANNATFLHLWTSGRIHWEPANHWILACYFYVITMAGLAFGAIGIDKSIGKSRFVGFAQAILTLAIIEPMTRWLGIPGLIIAVTLPFIPGMTLFGVRYLGGITGFPSGPLAWQGIIRPTITAPLAAATAWACSGMQAWLPGYAGLLLSAFTGTMLAVGIMIYLGVSYSVRLQMLSFATKILNKLLPARQRVQVESDTANH